MQFFGLLHGHWPIYAACKKIYVNLRTTVCAETEKWLGLHSNVISNSFSVRLQNENKYFLIFSPLLLSNCGVCLRLN